jgi:hypothetical protein
VRLLSQHGPVELAVPAGSRFTLEARAAHRDVEATLRGLVVTEGGRARFRATMGGGGSAVTLSADPGDVRVRAAGAAREDEDREDDEE